MIGVLVEWCVSPDKVKPSVVINIKVVSVPGCMLDIGSRGFVFVNVDIVDVGAEFVIALFDVNIVMISDDNVDLGVRLFDVGIVVISVANVDPGVRLLDGGIVVILVANVDVGDGLFGAGFVMISGVNVEFV